MKKISTLLIFCALAGYMFALPQNALPKLEQAPQNAAKAKAVALTQRDVTKRVARPVQTDMAEKHIADNAKHTIQRVQKAAKETTITLDGGVFLVEPEYEAETSEWYIAVESHGYTFRLCWFGKPDTYCGTFGFDDISWDWTWGWFQSPDLFYEIYPSDITFTISEEHVSNYLTQIVLDATITDTEDNIYVLHIVHKMFSPKSTVETVIENTQLSMGEGQFTLDGNADNLDVVLTVNSSTLDGYYNQDYFDMTNTKILYNGVEQQMLQATLLVEGGRTINGSLGYQVDFSFYNQDTILHTVSMPAPLPPVKDTLEVYCTNLEVDESLADFGFIMVSGSNDLYDIFAMYEGTVAEAGVYNVSIAITDKLTWAEPTNAISAVLTLTEDANGWHANIEAYGSDYNWYSINMEYVVPEPTDTVKITFPASAIGTYLPYDDNMLQLLHYGEDYEASLTVFGTALGESFTMDNVILDYSGIYDAQEGFSVRIADVKGTLNQFGDTTVINASIIGFNAIQYDVELWYAVPTPVDTVEIEMPIEFINTMADGYYTLAAYTPDSAWYISLSPITQDIAGTFVNDGLFGKLGEEDGRYDFYGGNTFIYSSAEWANYTMEKGTMVVEMTPAGKITAQVDMICSNAVYYHIVMTSEYNTHLDYDEPDIEVDRTYTAEDNVFIEDQTAENGYIYLAITAADDSDMCAFFFYVEEIDYDIYIPEGVYPINYTEEYGTVQANPGVQGNGVLPSFYAELAEDGLAVPLWLLVDGTVEVTKTDAGTPYLEVNAVNSYGVPVHIIYDSTDSTPTAVSDTQYPISDTRKVLRNGQLLILRNGETYNALGNRL